MAVTNPKKTQQTSYRGNTYNFLYDFVDSGGSDIDLSADYNDITYRVFESGKKSSPYVELSVSGGGLTIANTNELTGEITASQTEGMPAVAFYELDFTLSDGSEEVYLFGRHKAENYQSSEGEVSAEYTITINQSTNEVTFAESYDAAAKATQAKVDAETAEAGAQAIKDSLEWKGIWDNGTTYKEGHRVSYVGESFISLQDGNQGNTPVGDAGDSFWDILAEKGTVSDLDSISDVDLSGAEDGDLIQRESGVYTSRPVYSALSRVIAGGGYDKIVAWDTFIRADGAISDSDSGHTWIDWEGSLTVEDNKAKGSLNPSRGVINITSEKDAQLDRAKGSFSVSGNIGTSGGGYGGYIYGVDSNNYILVGINEDTLQISSVIGGVATIENTQTVSTRIQYIDKYIEALFAIKPHNNTFKIIAAAPSLNLRAEANLSSEFTLFNDTNRYVGIQTFSVVSVNDFVVRRIDSR